MIVGAIVWGSHNIPTAAFVLLIVGFSIIAVPIIVFAILKFISKIRPKIDKPERFVFPYIRSVNGSPLLNENDFLAITYCYPSGLPYDWVLSQVRGNAIIDGTPTREELLRPITIGKYACGETLMEVQLSDAIAKKVKGQVERREAIQIQMKVVCWDGSNRQHDLSTSQLTIVPLK